MGDAAPGHPQYEMVRQGRLGTDSNLREYLYTTRTTGGVTVVKPWRHRVFPNEEGLNSQTTEYAYTWHDGTNQVRQRTTTLPAVSVEKHGSGNSDTRRDWFDLHGRITWSMDERGRVTHHQYDPVTGARTRTIEDVASGQAGALDPPAGWTIPADGLKRRKR